MAWGGLTGEGVAGAEDGVAVEGLRLRAVFRAEGAASEVVERVDVGER